MDILFRRSVDGRQTTLVTRRDGVRLSVPVFGKLDPLPHDLAHYVIEQELGLPNGFWGSVAAGAIFEGMLILEGRQPPHARERSRAIMKAHHRGIIFSEVVVEVAVRAVLNEPLDQDPLPIESPFVASRTRADRDALLARLLPAIRAMCLQWQAVRVDGSLLVIWPDPDGRARHHRRGSHR
jgi:hypothetical protein